MITLKDNNWSLQIDLNGGRIVQLKKGNQEILGTFNRIDGKIGNTHLCVPNFGIEGKDLGLPFHGLARQATWQASDISEGSKGTFDVLAERVMRTVRISTILPKTSLYPARLKIDQTFKLEDKFIHQIEVSNIDNKRVPVNLGIHYYWDTPAGWVGAKINNVYISKLIKNNKIMKLSNKFKINFPEQKPITIEQTGFSNIVLWAGFKEQDNHKIYDQKYCCIEPVVGSGKYFGSKKSLLPPGRSIKTEFTIQA